MKDEVTRVALYGRVSTDSQDAQLQFEELQPHLPEQRMGDRRRVLGRDLRSEGGLGATTTHRGRPQGTLRSRPRLAVRPFRQERQRLVAGVGHAHQPSGSDSPASVRRSKTNSPVGRATITILAAVAELERKHHPGKSSGRVGPCPAKGTKARATRARSQMSRESPQDDRRGQEPAVGSPWRSASASVDFFAVPWIGPNRLGPQFPPPEIR